MWGGLSETALANHLLHGHNTHSCIPATEPHVFVIKNYITINIVNSQMNQSLTWYAIRKWIEMVLYVTSTVAYEDCRFVEWPAAPIYNCVCANSVCPTTLLLILTIVLMPVNERKPDYQLVSEATGRLFALRSQMTDSTLHQQQRHRFTIRLIVSIASCRPTCVA